MKHPLGLTEENLEFMREDLRSNMSLSRMIMNVQERFKKEGRDFDKEFDEWKKNNPKRGGG